MRELPILFSGPMVRAILALLKWMTRRVVNRLRGFGEVTEFGPSDTKGYDWHFRDRRGHWNDISHQRLLECCPYGQVGDRLWVRESWGCQAADRPGVSGGRKPQPGDAIQYAANEADAWQWRTPGSLPWRPSIHMPRWASRITLEVTSVRVERLQDISEADAIAEGMQEPSLVPITAACWSERHVFSRLWKHLNGDDSWEANPWVWVIEFKRVEQCA